MRKQIASTLTAAITAASLVACGGSTTATTAAQETTTAAAQETQVAEGAEESAGLEPVTLTLADSAAKGKV